MWSFENRRVLVTGSGRGIGKAIAHRFARGGAKVLLVSRSRNELDDSRAELLELTCEVHAVALDLTLPDSARQLVANASELWGGLDILVTNAPAEALRKMGHAGGPEHRRVYPSHIAAGSRNAPGRTGRCRRGRRLSLYRGLTLGAGCDYRCRWWSEQRNLIEPIRVR